ncbi:MAG: aldo/keto reductase [Clostridia bacterium]|nr:aldo/keto reductase [Clostridia bacterium]
MEYRTIQGVDKPVSRLLFGTASPAFTPGRPQSELLDAAFAAGINAFDTARVYGLAEKSLGLWLQERGNREQVVILTKCAHPDGSRKRVTEKDIREDFAVSSSLLGTDYVDIYVLHRDDPDQPAGLIVEILNAMHAEGKIGAFGGSNWTHERIQEANEYAYRKGLIPFTVSSPHYSLARQQEDPWGGGCVSLTGDESKAARDWYQTNQMPVIAYSSLGRGLLTGKVRSTDMPRITELLDVFAVRGYGSEDNFRRLARCEELAAQKHCGIAQLAMAWIYRQPLNTFAIATMSSPKRIQENVDALSLELTDAECRYLNLEDS